MSKRQIRQRINYDKKNVPSGAMNQYFQDYEVGDVNSAKEKIDVINHLLYLRKYHNYIMKTVYIHGTMEQV